MPRGQLGQARPRNPGMAMVREVVVIVERKPPRGRRYPEIPRAIGDVPCAPGVVDVLQRRPVQGEQPVR